MQFDNSFTVDKPIEEVWQTLLDLERVVPCVPGGKIVEKTSDTAIKAEIKIKLGAMNLTYTGPAEIVDRDDDTHTAALTAKARERGGQGNAESRVQLTLNETDGGTEVSIHSDVKVSGRAAAMGSGVIGGVTEGMIAEFAECLSKL